MKCVNCSREISENNAFCGYCGAPQPNVNSGENGAETADSRTFSEGGQNYAPPTYGATYGAEYGQSGQTGQDYGGSSPYQDPAYSIYGYVPPKPRKNINYMRLAIVGVAVILLAAAVIAVLGLACGIGPLSFLKKTSVDTDNAKAVDTVVDFGTTDNEAGADVPNAYASETTAPPAETESAYSVHFAEKRVYVFRNDAYDPKLIP